MLEDVFIDEDQENNPQDPPDDDEDVEKDVSDDFVINMIVFHRSKRCRNQKYADHGERLYRVRKYAYKPFEDMWLQICHTSRNKIINYCNL